MHPTIRLLFWLLFMLAIQWLDGWILVAIVLALPLIHRNVFPRGSRLVWRARWLLLSLFFVFAWGVAGEPLWRGVGAPTREGLSAALMQLGRLLVMLMAVAAFLENMPLSQLLTATHRMFNPLRRLGLDPDRGVVRLMLVLRYVETLPRPRDWRTLLNAPVGKVSEVLEVDEHPLRWSDYAVLFVACAMFIFFVFK